MENVITGPAAEAARRIVVVAGAALPAILRFPRLKPWGGEYLSDPIRVAVSADGEVSTDQDVEHAMSLILTDASAWHLGLESDPFVPPGRPWAPE